MKLRDDIDPAKTWVWSDTHFGHKNIIGYCHRPANFEDILLEELAAVVKPGDTILHLGDLCYKGNSWFKNVISPKISALEARQLLILGNHDKQRNAFYRHTGWQPTAPFYLPVAEGRAVEPDCYDTVVSFSHYPWSEKDRRGKLPGEFESMSPNHWRIHGHIHNNGYFDGRSFSPPRWDLIPFLRNHVNISVEQTKYKPLNLELLLDAVLYGRMPQPRDLPGDGDAPSGSEIGKENPHA